MPRRSKELREAILQEIFWSPRSPVRRIAQRFDVTPSAVQAHVRGLIAEKLLIAHGERRYRTYRLPVVDQHEQNFPLNGSFPEDKVWRDFLRPLVQGLSDEDDSICHWGLTEMFNNAIDHSGGSIAAVRLTQTPISLTIRVEDNGQGIFRKIADALGLSDPRQSLLELSKGKFTTDPERHTGEGIFFTSRLFDRFAIRSDELLFTHSTRTDDWLVEVEDRAFKGTRLIMSLLVPTKTNINAVIARFSSGPDEHRFAKTHVPLKLATYGDDALISRSAAKRVLARVDRFDEFLLDFTKVTSIGQAFADEIFRVFANSHPKVELIAINANEQVTGMIRRAEANRREQAGQSGD